MKKVYTIAEFMQNEKITEILGNRVFSSYGGAAQLLMKNGYIFVKDSIECYWYHPDDPDDIYLVIRECIFK